MTLETVLLVIPIILFFISVLYYLLDDSASIFIKNNIPVKWYRLYISISDIKEAIELNHENKELVNKLNRVIKNRRIHFIFLVLTFFSVLLVSCLKLLFD